MKKTFFSVLFFLICGTIVSQNFIRPNEWKKYRREIYVSAGAANFLGDLGGLNKVGTDYSPVDIEFTQTRTAFGLGYRYKVLKWLNFTTSFDYLLVRGDDKLTKEPFRENRNLNFKTNIFELAERMELVWMKNQVGHRYGIKKTLVRRMKNRSWDFSGFFGIGVFYYNPKGRDAKGNWVALKPLHTEGQGLDGGPKQYKNFALCLPMGLAYRIYFSRVVVVGVEFCFRKTFTDYIDDVSGVYYDNNAIQAAYGTKAAQFADPNLGLIPGQTNWNIPGSDQEAQLRGQPQKDAYMSLQVTVGYIIKKKHGKSRLRSKF